MTLFQAKAAIRERMMKLDAIHRNYLEYLKDRVYEHDWHGTWDGGANLSETECEQAGLRFAMDLLDQVDVPQAVQKPQDPFNEPGAIESWTTKGAINGTG
jgi:hypothetical protein